MALSNYKQFNDGEVLTAGDLNLLQSHFTGNALTLISPLTGSLDTNGNSIVLDADADSSIRETSDDVIALRLQGLDAFIFDGDVSTPVNGFTFVSSATGVPPAILAQGTDSNIDVRITPKGTGTPTIGATDIKPFLYTYAVNSANQNISAGVLTDVTSLTALNLPNTAATLTSRRFLVHYVFNVIDTSAAANIYDIRLYNGPNGNKNDTLVYTTVNVGFASNQCITSGMFLLTPGASDRTKIGLACSSLGNATIEGTSTQVCTIWAQEVT